MLEIKNVSFDVGHNGNNIKILESKGVTGNAAQNILINKGFKKVYNLSGGHRQFSKMH